MLANVRSLVKNSAAFMADLSNHKYDLAFITESWLRNTIDLSPLLGHLSGMYEGVRCDRAHKIGGGVILIVRRL